VEESTEQQITIRQVTDMQASYTELERGSAGAFTLQLILDDGAEEYVLQPTADDMKVMLRLAQNNQAVMFDLERKVLVTSNLSLD
jgi:hypothetical protein